MVVTERSKKQVIGVYLELDVLETIEFLAHQSKRSRNSLISEMISFAADCYFEDRELMKKIRNEFDDSLKSSVTSN